jgi:hypothetical protein
MKLRKYVAGKHMVEDTTMNSEQLERVGGGVVMPHHWSDDAVEINRGELIESSGRDWRVLRRSSQLFMKGVQMV